MLSDRPKGEPADRTRSLVESPLPTPAAGQMLLRTVFLSLDPYMCGRMSDAASYAKPVEIGAVMVGGTVAMVVESNIEGFAPGDWVLSFNGWQDYAVSDGTGAARMDQSPSHPSWARASSACPVSPRGRD